MLEGKMSGIFHTDGCVKANIRTSLFNVFLGAKCEHTKIKAAVITMSAESREAAWEFAETWLRQGPLRGQTEVLHVEPV